jgi:hypothetical protein
MSKKILPLAVALVVMILLSAMPVIANGSSKEGFVSVAATPTPLVYVKPDYAGNESGTKDQPYNKLAEGIAFARSSPTGGNVCILDAAGNCATNDFYARAIPIQLGVPFSRLILYALLWLLALALMLSGWLLWRRAVRPKV